MTCRTQSVVIDAKESSETSLSSGVPQGSVIGPAKFLFYVNDLPDNSRTFIRFFADDTIAYNSACNHSTPQEDLTKLEQWEHSWVVEFHPSKCEHVIFSRRGQLIDKNLYLHSIMVLKTNYIRYLGVTLDPKLTGISIFRQCDR